MCLLLSFRRKEGKAFNTTIITKDYSVYNPFTGKDNYKCGNDKEKW